MVRYSIWLLLLLSACSREPTSPLPWVEISGRDELPLTGKVTRYPLYRTVVPVHWKREEPPTDQSNFDTTLPIATFYVDEITLWVHNFPANALSERIPPGAQIARWKRQLTPSPHHPTEVKPVAHGGFSGLYLEGEGELKGEEQGVLAWAMQLGQDHFQALLIEGSPEEERFYRQMRADYTIKAVGPSEKIRLHKHEIHQFARRFELIQEVPSRS